MMAVLDLASSTSRWAIRLDQRCLVDGFHEPQRGSALTALLPTSPGATVDRNRNPARNCDKHHK